MARYEPTDTITWEATQVVLSQQATAALLEFANTDSTRAHLYSVGISDGCLCATDGHTLLRYDAPQCEPVSAKGLHSRYWSRDYVQTRLGIAKVEKKDVVLELSFLQSEGAPFPPVNQVVPEPGLTYGRNGKGVERSKAHPIGFNPDYFARLSKVCKAVKLSGATCGAALVSAGSELDPVAFEITYFSSPLKATVVIMPMSVD